MIRRHPHIFSDESAESIEDLKQFGQLLNLMKVKTSCEIRESICRPFHVIV